MKLLGMFLLFVGITAVAGEVQDPFDPDREWMFDASDSKFRTVKKAIPRNLDTRRQANQTRAALVKMAQDNGLIVRNSLTRKIRDYDKEQSLHEADLGFQLVGDLRGFLEFFMAMDDYAYSLSLKRLNLSSNMMPMPAVNEDDPEAEPIEYFGHILYADLTVATVIQRTGDAPFWPENHKGHLYVGIMPSLIQNLADALPGHAHLELIKVRGRTITVQGKARVRAGELDTILDAVSWVDDVAPTKHNSLGPSPKGDRFACVGRIPPEI